MMAPVPPYGHKVPMLAGGDGAQEFVDQLAPFGISAEIVSREVGTAAATKMFRSIIVKGLEALLTECVLGASRYNADERVFASLAESFPGIQWKQLADYMVGRVVVHGERRAREMEEVAATLREIDIEPIMAEAIVRRMDWSVEAGLKQLFGGEAPKSYRACGGRNHQKTGGSTLRLPRFLLFVAAFSACAGLCLAVDLKPETVEAFDRYIASTEAKNAAALERRAFPLV